jgi:serine/threonine protein kinase
MATDDPLIGYQLGNFRLERVIGRGGMAQVYYGHDIKLNRPVAIKVIDARFRANPEYVKRFVREARAVALWRHENIMQIYYADDQEGLYYFVMEYIEGMDLGALIAAYNMEGELIPHSDVARIGRAVANALDYAHHKGVIHRDVKPSNVMVQQSGRVVLADFGLAMEVGEESMGEVFGTARYISPEQARRSADAVPQSDLYSLGVMLFEMLTGVPPFDDTSPTSTAIQHITQPPPTPSGVNPNLSPEMDAVLLKALGKSPTERYQTGKALMEALETALLTCALVVTRPTGGEGIELPPPPPQWRSPATPSLSQVSVVERVAIKLAAAPAPAAEPAKPVTPATREPARARTRRMVWGGVMAVALVVIAWVIGGQWTAQAQAVASQTAQAIAALTQSAVAPTRHATATTPSATPAPSRTPIPPTVTVSLTPSQTSPASPTPTPSATPTPTLLYPNGTRLQMFYSDKGFYLRNLGTQRIGVGALAFEAMNDEANIPNGFRYNGSRWADLFQFMDPRDCNALEDSRTGSIDKRPVQCQDHMNVIRTLDIANSQYVFWLPRENSATFRVLWREEEVGRCAIELGVCEVLAP